MDTVNVQFKLGYLVKMLRNIKTTKLSQVLLFI